MRLLSLYILILLCSSIVAAEESHRGQSLQHNRGTEALLQQELKSIPESHYGDRALYRGTLWFLHFIDDNAHFQFIFTDAIRTLETISMQMPPRPKRRKGQHFYYLQTLAKRTLKHSLLRASEHLEYYFSRDSEGAFSFLELGSVLSRPSVKHIAPTYTTFYQLYFPSKKHLFYDRSFFHALHVRDYSLLSDYVIESSFPYFLHVRPSMTITPPEVHFENYIKALSELPYVSPADKDLRSRMIKHDFVVQLILVLSNHGRAPFQHTPHGDRLRRYLVREFPDIYQHTHDVRLLADATRALLILGITTHPYAELGITRLIALQHADGSWGSAEDSPKDPYEQFQQTSAALAALALAAQKGILYGIGRKSP